MFSICVAMDKNGLIGSKNRLPWYLPEDLRRFRSITMGKPIIMGHNTYKSIGRPLDGRNNIILSRDKDLIIDDCIVVNTAKELMVLQKVCYEVVVIGGEQVYKMMLPYVNKMYITRINAEFKGDTYFPEFNDDDWKETDRQDYKTNTGLQYSFITLSNKY